MIRNWLRSRAHLKPRPVQARPQLEMLEDRTVPATLIALTRTQQLLMFDSNDPSVILNRQQLNAMPQISGLTFGNERIKSIDTRPVDGLLYGLSNRNILYTLDPMTQVATRVGNTDPAFGLMGRHVGIDFNPTVDRLRVDTNATQNFRINPNDGTIVNGAPDTPLAYGPGPFQGVKPSVVEVAYTNNFAGATVTTLFGIDANVNQLVMIGGVNGNPSPNGGQVTAVGPLGLDVVKSAGFEITNGGEAFAALIGPSGLSRLFTVDLQSGQVTSLGAIGGGAFKIFGLTEFGNGGEGGISAASQRLSSNADLSIRVDEAPGIAGVLLDDQGAFCDYLLPPDVTGILIDEKPLPTDWEAPDEEELTSEDAFDEGEEETFAEIPECLESVVEE